MMRKIIFVTILFLAVLAGNTIQVSAQDIKNKSNGILEIIALYVPDFIVIKPAKGIEIREYTAYLISEKKSFEALRKTGRGGNYEKDEKGNGRTVLTDKSEIRLMNFSMTDMESLTLKIQKIKFVIDGKEMYYDLEKSEWE